DTQVNLSWSASVDNPSGSGVAGYRIFQQGANIATVTGTSYQRTGLSPVTTYSFEVEAFDNNGNPDAVLNSNRSNKVVITTSGTIPDPAGKTPTFTATPASLNF